MNGVEDGGKVLEKELDNSTLIDLRGHVNEQILTVLFRSQQCRPEDNGKILDVHSIVT